MGYKEMNDFRMTPGFVAWIHTQKGHVPWDIQEEMLIRQLAETIKHVIFGYSKNRTSGRQERKRTRLESYCVTR